MDSELFTLLILAIAGAVTIASVGLVTNAWLRRKELDVEKASIYAGNRRSEREAEAAALGGGGGDDDGIGNLLGLLQNPQVLAMLQSLGGQKPPEGPPLP